MKIQKLQKKVANKLAEIYSGKDLAKTLVKFDQLLQNYNTYPSNDFQEVATPSEKSVYLITYGDAFTDANRPALSVLKEVLDAKLSETFTDVHLLPMFPYTSDDGFSVADYEAIKPELGSWSDVDNLAENYQLMFDFVANHMSKSSDWFQKFLDGASDFENAFIRFDRHFDTSKVIRPRVSPLFHDYRNGQKVWTTFSEDQVDVNAQDPAMLARLTQVLLDYARRGATSIRLDAIGFLWKASGTTCMHLPQTHVVIQLWRLLLDAFAPGTQIITETNVPHADNISYFGNGTNEAHMIYQFPLPPLVLQAFITGDASKLTNWAADIDRVSDSATYFNFLASHDGIGLRPTEGILTDEEREAIVRQVLANGGRVSYKNNPDGSQSVYELNINYSEALGSAEKMLAAHHILLSVIGVPAIYYHSIFGSKNDEAAVKSSGINRRINREKLDKTRLFDELAHDDYRATIYNGIQQLIKIRQKEKAFNPYGSQKVVKFDRRIFALEREFLGKKILSLTNISGEGVELGSYSGFDLISNREITKLAAYGMAWIKEDD